MTQDALSRFEDDTLRDRVDPGGFRERVERLPDQARAAWELGLSADLPGIRTPDRVLIAGLGGSAIGADIAATVAQLIGTTPIEVVRNYHLPPLTAGTLVLLSSFSGNTEETLAAFEEVRASKAMGVALTTGGRLGAVAKSAGMPVISYEWDGPPRTGIGYGTFLPLAILRRVANLPISDADVEAAIHALETSTRRYGLDGSSMRAKALASWVHGGAPAIIGADMLDVAARRWAGEFSENAKQVAAAYGIPEFNHNQLEAAARVSTEADPIRFIILDAPAVHPRNRLRVRETAEMMLAAGRSVQVADAGGDTALEAILAACVLGTWTSYYLALLREVDPAPMTVMDRLKRVMSQES